MKSLEEPNQELLERLGSGRRITNLCMFSWLAASAFKITETPFANLFFVGSIFAAIVGTKRIAEGLELRMGQKWIACLGAAIPVVGLLVMAWVNGRAVRVLHSAGYKVGMFQSSRAHEA